MIRTAAIGYVTRIGKIIAAILVTLDHEMTTNGSQHGRAGP